jgi:DNA-binding response OmpR family regulator
MGSDFWMLASGACYGAPPARQQLRVGVCMSVTGQQNVILCVDDEQMALKCRQLILEHAGYKVFTALDSELALHLFRHNHIDLVITDHLLPGRNGCDMAAEMKRDAPSIPIMLLSGLADSPDTSGVIDTFVVKGSPPPEFLETVASMLSAK